MIFTVYCNILYYYYRKAHLLSKDTEKSIIVHFEVHRKFLNISI